MSLTILFKYAFVLLTVLCEQFYHKWKTYVTRHIEKLSIKITK